MQKRRKQSQIIQILFSNRKIEELRQYLDQNPQLDLIQLTDNQNNTILHQLAYQGQIDILRLFVHRAKKYLVKKFTSKSKMYQKDENKEITAWMNQQNNQGFTAVLYASYNGHMDVIRYLIDDYHVNYKISTNTGLNPLHLAAQANMVLPFIYFRQMISINDVDQSRSSPLHWASYMSSQDVVSYLLSCPELVSLDERDAQGNTPLMMAVNYGNTRVVRKLLIKGANRYVRNNLNQKPIQIARQNQYKTITKMLNQQYGCCDFIKFYCNVKMQYKPKNRSCTIPLVFIFAFILNIGILNLMIKFNQYYSLALEGAVFGIMIILYFSLLRGPKKITQKRNIQQLLGENTKAIKAYCFQCRINYPKRGHHCQICKICVMQYDHHCTWINNCVGKKNIGRFVFFLLFLILSLGLLGLVSFLSELSIIIDKTQLYSKWFTFRFLQVSQQNKIMTVCLLSINFITSLFVIPLLALFFVQIKNLLKNKTTYETYRNPPQQSNEIKQRIRKYDSRVSIRNCRVMCKDNSSSTYSTTSKQIDSNKQIITGRSFNHNQSNDPKI